MRKFLHMFFRRHIWSCIDAEPLEEFVMRHDKWHHTGDNTRLTFVCDFCQKIRQDEIRGHHTQKELGL